MTSKVRGGGGGGKEGSGFDGLVSGVRLGLRDLLFEDDKQVSRAGLIVSSTASSLKMKDSGSGDGGSSPKVKEERAGGIRMIVFGKDPVLLQDIKKQFEAHGSVVTTCSCEMDPSSMFLGQKNKFGYIVSALDIPDEYHQLLDGISIMEGLPLLTISRDVHGILLLKCARKGPDYVVKPKQMNVPSVGWSLQLYRQFHAALRKLGDDEAVPEKLLELMDDAPGLTLDVSRHLKEYRLRHEKRKNMRKKKVELQAKLRATDPHTKPHVTSPLDYDLFGMAVDPDLLKLPYDPCDWYSGLSLKSPFQGNSSLSPSFCGL